MRAGKPRLEAFKNFAQRTKVDDVRSLVAMLIQTDRFGTSVAQALRTHADVSRTKRRQRAEERAAKIGVKLVFPLVFCPLSGVLRRLFSGRRSSSSSQFIGGADRQRSAGPIRQRQEETTWIMNMT